MRNTAFFAVLFLLSVLFAGAAEQRPNILFIFTDDHAYQAIGAYGSNRNETPNMDKLAAEGMRFTNCCVTNSICGPCRAVVQTGKYSHINGFQTNGDKFDNTQQTFPKLLQKAGYQTAIVGKWHLVSEVTGFDYSEILIGQGPYYNPPMILNGKRVPHQGRTTEIITQLSLDYLKNRDKDKPFLLMMQHKAPHREWDPSPKFYEQYKNRVFPEPETFNDNYANRSRAALEQDMTIAETLNSHDLKLEPPLVWKSMTEEQKTEWHKMFDCRQEEFAKVKDDPVALKKWKYQCYMKDYLSVVAEVDDSIGQVLKFLDNNGLSENTVVIYASDQGFYLGEHGWFDKRFMFEQSYKTPFIVRYPGKVKAGSVNNDIVSNLDYAETFLDIAGVKIPDDMQGRSLLPLLEGKKPADWRKSLYYHYYEYPAVHFVKKHEGIYDGRFKLIHYYDDIDEWELIDLQTDPNELRNAVADPKYTADVDRLKQELELQKTKLKVPPLEINTKSYLTDEEQQNKRPKMKPQFERLHQIVEERKKHL
ncbi:N-acetylglucosamine-6-sulfatase [Planctomycetales bacterium]|nr:N-acetylglucosamine-6-sulfatase [Planctomycetales bacterium]